MSAEQHVRRGARPQSLRKPVGPRYRFRDGIWAVICRDMEWPNTFAASKALGVADTTITRGLEGYPGEHLMAAVMAALPRTWKFEHIFELVTDEPTPLSSVGAATVVTVGSVLIFLELLFLLGLLGIGAR